MRDQDIQTACSEVGHILGDLLNSEPNGSERMAASIAVSMAALMGTATSVMDGFNPDRGKLPTEDHILFCALLVWGSCNLEGRGGIHVTTSPEMVVTAMDNFKKFTGQDARPLLNKSMMKVVDAATKVDRSQFGQNARFLPH